MHRQKFNVRKPHASQESLLNRQAGGLYCPKCQQPVKRRHAVHAGSRRSRCPACGEMLEQQAPAENGQTPEGPPTKSA
jgi:hypothetical protein